MSWLRRLSNTFRPLRVQRDIERELSFHMAERADQLRADGVHDDEATRRARVQFGNPTVLREQTRDMDVAGWMDASLGNLRHAGRTLARTPAFTLTVVMTLALGIGANSSAFSAINAVLLRPLPFPDGDRLVQVTQVEERSGRTNIPPVRLEDWNRLNTTFEAMAGYFTDDVVDTTGDLPERMRRAVVTPRFLDVWRIAPSHGRAFAADEHRFGGPTVMLVSDRIWRDRIDANPAAIGSTIRSAGVSVTIVGVMPAAMSFPGRDVDVWAPMPVDAPFAQSRLGGWYPAGIGRLKAGVTLAQARADLERVQARLGAQYPDSDQRISLRVVPLKETIVGGVVGSLWLVFGAVSVLLLIACTNVAALLFSRAVQREPEIAVRYALGASRRSVAGQMLAEAAVLAFGGAAVGLLAASGASSAIRLLAPDMPRLDEITIDARILLYTVASAVIVTLACGLVPAFRGARRTSASARSGRHVVPRQSLQWLLVGVQVALSVTLLAGSGLLLRSLDALSRVAPGFDSSGVLTFRVTGRFGEDGGDYWRVVERINGTLDALLDVRGIRATATAATLPGLPGQNEIEFTLVEARADGGSRIVGERRYVSPGYFETMGIPLLAGDHCRRESRAASEAMVNRSFMERYVPDRTVVGLHLIWESVSPPLRVAGVVENAREIGMDRDPVPTVYACLAAPSPAPWFLVRTDGDPLAAAGAVRLKIKDLEPLRPVYDIAALDTRIDAAHAQTRLRTVVLTLFAVTALGLVCAGVYGTLSYAVGLRRREVALHLALGALRRDVVRRLIGRSLMTVAVASACGLVVTLIVTRSLSTMLYGVSPFDPATLSGVLVVVLTVAAMAAVIPAARAAFVEPMRVLRDE